MHLTNNDKRNIMYPTTYILICLYQFLPSTGFARFGGFFVALNSRLCYNGIKLINERISMLTINEVSEHTKQYLIENDLVDEDGYIFSCCFTSVNEQGFCTDCWEHCV